MGCAAAARASSAALTSFDQARETRKENQEAAGARTIKEPVFGDL